MDAEWRSYIMLDTHLPMNPHKIFTSVFITEMRLFAASVLLITWMLNKDNAAPYILGKQIRQ